MLASNIKFKDLLAIMTTVPAFCIKKNYSNFISFFCPKRTLFFSHRKLFEGALPNSWRKVFMRTGAGKARSNVFFGDLCPSTRKRSLKTIAAKFRQRENWVNLLPIKVCKNPLQKKRKKRKRKFHVFATSNCQRSN